jgi:hypothetical protein
MTDVPNRGHMGSTHLCQSCGYELLLGPGHHMDLAVCVACGADFVVEYAPTVFVLGHCTAETPGTLVWSNSDALKADDRDNRVELRYDVLPLPKTDLPDLRGDTCPNCKSAGSLVLNLPDEFECPRCHNGLLKKVSDWIQ